MSVFISDKDTAKLNNVRPSFYTKVTPNLNINARVSWSLLLQEWIPKAVELERIPTHTKYKCKEFAFRWDLVVKFTHLTYITM